MDGFYMDCWNPETFDAELAETLKGFSSLIVKYYQEDRRLMQNCLNNKPYESLKPNKYHSKYIQMHEHVVTLLILNRRIRVWHYTRLLDEEVSSMESGLVLSTLSSLKKRLDTLVHNGLLTQEDVDTVYKQSPFHSEENARSGRLWATIVPLQPTDTGVELLLGSWGGESACFSLSDQNIAVKLGEIGKPRILEIETALHDSLNAFSVAETVIKAYAKSASLPVNIEGSDLSITGCLNTAKVLRVHTAGDGFFEKVAESYPLNCEKILPNYDMKS